MLVIEDHPISKVEHENTFFFHQGFNECASQPIEVALSVKFNEWQTYLKPATRVVGSTH